MEKLVKAVFGSKKIIEDPVYENLMASHLAVEYSFEERMQFLERFRFGEGKLDGSMRRIILKSVLKQMGNDVSIGSGVLFIHPETIEIGDGVFIGDQTIIQGRKDGKCIIGDKVWIGPQSYFDARDLVIEDYVGWGPGAKVLGSKHTGDPVDMPIINTDLTIKPVRICKNSDIGVNAVIMPGVTVGDGSVIGAGAVVIKDVPPYSVAAGVPAKIIRKRM